MLQRALHLHYPGRPISSGHSQRTVGPRAGRACWCVEAATLLNTNAVGRVAGQAPAGHTTWSLQRRRRLPLRRPRCETPSYALFVYLAWESWMDRSSLQKRKPKHQPRKKSTTNNHTMSRCTSSSASTHSRRLTSPFPKPHLHGPGCPALRTGRGRRHLKQSKQKRKKSQGLLLARSRHGALGKRGRKQG